MDETALIRLGIFAGALLLFSILEALFPRRDRVQGRLRRWLTNLSLVISGSLSLMVLGPLIAVGVAAWASQNGWGLLNLVDWPVWMEFGLAFLMLDFVIWLQHVATHKIPVLWRLHKVHHADRDLDASSGVRFHPIEILLSMLFKCVMVLWLGPMVLAVLVFEIALNATAIFSHANLKLPLLLDRTLRKIIVTPDMHRVHHSIIMRESQMNYGFNFSFWDRLFRTYQFSPSQGQTGMTLGLEDAQTNATQRFGWSLWLPFKKSNPMI